MSIYDIISEILYRHREKNGWSKTQMARRCDLSEREYGDWERGNRLPSLKNMVRLSKELDIDLNELKEASDDSLSMQETTV